MTEPQIDYKQACRTLGRVVAQLGLTMQAAVIAEKQGERGMTWIEENLDGALMLPGAAGHDCDWDGTEKAFDYFDRQWAAEREARA